MKDGRCDFSRGAVLFAIDCVETDADEKDDAVVKRFEDDAVFSGWILLASLFH
jgi:hypothetical protein